MKGQHLARHTLGKGYSDIVLEILYGKVQAELLCDSNLQWSSQKGGGRKSMLEMFRKYQYSEDI